MASNLYLASILLIVNSISVYSLHSCPCLDVHSDKKLNSSVLRVTWDECQSVNGVYIRDLYKYNKCECCVIYKSK